MDVSKFIKCHGLHKDEIVLHLKDNNDVCIRIEDRYYAFIGENRISLVQWQDERTLVYFVEEGKGCIQFWENGKKIQQRCWKKDPSLYNQNHLLSICLEFYSDLDKININK